MKRILLLFSLMSIWNISQGQLTAPFTESFDNSSLPPGWVNNVVDPWLFSGNMAYDASIIGDHTGTAGSWFAWVDGSGGTNALTPLETDSIDVSGLTTPMVSFYLSSYNPTYVATDGSNTFSVDLYDGSSWNTGIYVHAGSFPGWRYVPIDISGYSISGKIVVRFNINTTTASGWAYYNDIAIDDVTVDEAPPCVQPINLVDSNITSSSADIAWSAVNGASSYTIIYGTSGFDPATAGSSTTSSNNWVTLTSLTGITDYDVYVIADCSTNGLSDTAGPLSFTTLCVPFSSPYFTDFDSDALNQSPACWSSYTSSPSGSIVEVTNFQSAHSGTQYLQIFSTFFGSVDTLVAISPEFSDLPLGTQQVHFWARTSAPLEELVVGTLTDPMDASTFTAIDTISFTTATSQTSPYEEFIIPITTSVGYNGTDKYIGLMRNNFTQFDYIDVDDFAVELIPACPQVTTLQADSVWSSGISISFNGAGNSFDYEYGPVGFSQGTGTTGSFTSNPGTISGLQDATCYDVYIRRNCSGSSNGTSAWSGPLTFCTTCLVQSLPYSEDFDISLGCFVPVDGGTSNNTWYKELNYFGSSIDGTPFAFVDGGSGLSQTYELMVSPYIDASNIQGTLTLEFDQYFQTWNSGDYANLEVWDGNQWVQILAQSGNVVGNWAQPDHQSIDLSMYANDSLQFRFEYDNNTTWAGYWAIDNVKLTDVLCVSSTDAIGLIIASDSIQIGWTPGTGSHYIVEFGASGFSPGGGTRVTTSDTNSIANGLSANTAYDFYITDSCALGNSLTSGPFTFTTGCATTLPMVLPWTEDFESYSTTHNTATNWCNTDHSLNYDNSDQNCQLRFNAGTGFYNNNSSAAATLDRLWTFGVEGSNFLTFTFNLSSYTSASGIILEFYYMHHGQENHPNDRVWARGSLSDPWVQIYDLNANHGFSGAYNHVTNLNLVSLLGNAGQSVSTTTQVRFGQTGTDMAFSTFWSDGYTFDDISLTAVSCPAPTALGTSSLVDTAATFSWLGGSGASGYEVWFGPTGFFQGSATIGGSRDTTNSASYLVDTLAPNTCYEYGVRTFCSSGDSSVWVGPFQFCTPCAPFNATHFEDFENHTTFETPDCWAELFVGANANFAYAEVTPFGGAHSGTNHLELNNNFQNDTVVAVSPHFDDMSPGDKRVSFQAKQSWGTGATLMVGTVSGQNKAGSFVAIDTLVLSDQYQKFTIPLTTSNGYNGTHEFIAFMHGLQSNFQVLYIDDVLYEPIPTCIEPVNLGASNIATSTADVYWGNQNASSGLGYQVQYGFSGTTLGASANTTVSSPNDTATLTGLSDGTDYCYWVRQICTVGDTSIWSGPHCFTTLCLPKTATWTEDFDAVQANSGLIPNCWSDVLIGINANWARVEVVTWGLPSTSPNHLEINNDSQNDTVMAVTPMFSDLPMGDKQIKFQASQSFGTGATLIIGTLASPSQAGSFNPIDTITLTASHQLFFVPLDVPGSGYNGTDEYIGFMHGQQQNWQTIYIDDFVYEVIPSCPDPLNPGAMNLTSTSADVFWTAGGPGTDFQISYGPGIATPGAGAIANATSSTHTLSSLSNATSYNYFVREVCGPGDTSQWVGPTTFRTHCLTQSLPYTEDFDLDLGCFVAIDGGATSDTWFQAQDKNGSSLNGTPFAFADSDGAGFNAGLLYELMESPPIDASNISGVLTLEFDQYFNSLSSFTNDSANVEVWDGTQWIRVLTQTNLDVGSWAAPDHQVIDITAYANAGLKVRFEYHDNATFAWFWAVDNFSLKDITNCPDPTGLGATNITTNSADLSWTAGTTGNLDFEIEYGIGLATPGTGTTVTINSGTNYSLTGLSTNAQYCYFVREICGPGDTSGYAGPYCFSTICPAPANAMATANVGCDSVEVSWTGNPNGSILEYGAMGFIPATGSGTVVGSTSPYVMTGLSPGTSYDVYIVDTCGNDTSGVTGPITVTTASGPLPIASYVYNITYGVGTQTINFDASGSTGATSYSWDFGNSNTGSGVTVSETYSANGPVNVQLTVANACGTDDTTITMAINIGLKENALSNSLQVFPNPTDDILNIVFKTGDSDEASIRVRELSGKEVLQVSKADLNGRYSGQISIVDLAKGVYVLEIESGGLTARRRIVKH